MLSNFARIAVVAFAMLPAIAAAEPITLKLAYFSSDRTHIYRSNMKPFVDAINREGKDRVRIEVYFSGELGSNVTKQSELVRKGIADIVYVVPPYERASFPDSQVIELPGLFRNARESTLVYTQLVQKGLIRDFDEFFVVGAFASEPEAIHTRAPVRSIVDLRNKSIRVINETEGSVLKKLGAKPVFVPLIKTAAAISSGEVDGAYVPPVPMIEFGIGRVAANHYFLKTSCVPLVLLMNRERFNALPNDVQAIIRKYSGYWLAERSIHIDESSTALVMDQLESDPRRTVVFPSAADMQKASSIFDELIYNYTADDPHHAALVEAARMETARLREEE